MLDWIIAAVATLALLVLLSPLLLLATVFILVPLAHLMPRAHPTLARLSFGCPFAKREASVAFLTVPGAGRPVDVTSCSIFEPGPVLCEKGCLGLVESRETASLAVARYALLADGETLRDATGHERSSAVDAR